MCERNDHQTFIVSLCAGRLEDYFRTELSSVIFRKGKRFGGTTLFSASVNNIKGIVAK